MGMAFGPFEAFDRFSRDALANPIGSIIAVAQASHHTMNIQPSLTDPSSTIASVWLRSDCRGTRGVLKARHDSPASRPRH